MKKIKVILSTLLCAAMLSCTVAAHEKVDIRLNGTDTEIGALLIGTTTYVPFDEANEVLSGGTAEIHGTAEAMRAVTPFATISAREGDCYIEAEGRYIGANNSIVVSGMLYVPIRSLAKIYNADVVWHDSTRSVDLYAAEGDTLTHGDSYYSSDEVYWLSRIINAEALGEPMEGKVLVGNVILNRVESSDFPNTIYGVIFDREHGVQFTPTVNGSVYNTPTEESIIAAKLCLDSYYISRSALYFLNPSIATNFWVPNNRPYLTTVGSHDFYS
ncbi:MAG: cell wall hydrolase [Clostridia bacterium]|nr:cell wall hydrolase [Clostridia bacterium]